MARNILTHSSPNPARPEKPGPTWTHRCAEAVRTSKIIWKQKQSRRI